MQIANSIAAGLAISAMLLGATPGFAGDDMAPAERGKRLADGAGVGGGLVIGGLLGGPLGMMVGAGLGTWLGSRVVQAGQAEEATAKLAQTERALDKTLRDLDATQSRAQTLEQDLVRRTEQVSRLETLAQRAELANQELLTALASGLEMQVMFRTGESELTAPSADQVRGLAGVLAGVDGLLVQLDGYADPRGAEPYNEALASARVASVERALLAGGLRAEQLEGFAHGERAYASQAGDYDAYALERRVDISLLAVEASSLGATALETLEEVDLAQLGER